MPLRALRPYAIRFERLAKDLCKKVCTLSIAKPFIGNVPWGIRFNSDALRQHLPEDGVISRILYISLRVDGQQTRSPFWVAVA